MKTLRHIVLVFFTLVLVANFAFAQGDFELRFNIYETDCQNMKLYVDLEVKAKDANSTFHISEQNYRFTFNDQALANPVLDRELTIAGQVSDDVNYAPHTLTGTKGNIVSYNVELNGTRGYHVTDNWVGIGRLAFDIIDTEAALEFTWHDYMAFPPTFVGEIAQYNRSRTGEAGYHNVSIAYSELCQSPTSIEDIYGQFIWELFPNPNVTTELSVKIKSAEFSGKAKLIVSNVEGKVIVDQGIEMNTGSNLFFVDTKKLPSGTYFIQLQHEEATSKAQKFIKVEE